MKESQNYKLLNLFKKEIEINKNSPENRPYSFLKPSILLYRIIFLTIGLTYFILAFIIHAKSLNWTCSLIFGSTLAVKMIILIICAGVSFISLYLGLFMKTERESVRLTILRAKKKLKKLYSHQFGALGLQRVFEDEKQNDQSSVIHQQLNRLFERFDHLQEECNHLINRIAQSDSLNERQKEELFNQAIIELKFKLENLIEAFEQKCLPISPLK